MQDSLYDRHSLKKDVVDVWGPDSDQVNVLDWLLRGIKTPTNRSAPGGYWLVEVVSPEYKDDVFSFLTWDEVHQFVSLVDPTGMTIQYTEFSNMSKVVPQ